MSSSVGLGVPVTKLLRKSIIFNFLPPRLLLPSPPTSFPFPYSKSPHCPLATHIPSQQSTGTSTLPFAAYLAFLSNRIVSRRLNREKWIGDNVPSDPELTVDSRAHANFLGNVPLAFTLSVIAELNGANRKVLNYALAALLTIRILHVEAGLKPDGNCAWGRPVGYFGTQGFLLDLAAYGGYLVKGYWGY